MKTLYTIGALLCAAAAFAQGIEITDAYARSAGPSAKTGAVFMVINNTGEEDVTLLGGQTEYAERAEIHTHNMNDAGIMQMTEVEGGLVIPAGQCVFLARGGYHVMMLGITKPMVNDEMLGMRLSFEDAEPMDVEIKIDSERGANVEPLLPKGRESCLSASDTMDHSEHMTDGESMDHDDHMKTEDH